MLSHVLANKLLDFEMLAKHSPVYSKEHTAVLFSRSLHLITQVFVLNFPISFHNSMTHFPSISKTLVVPQATDHLISLCSALPSLCRNETKSYWNRKNAHKKT